MLLSSCATKQPIMMKISRPTRPALVDKIDTMIANNVTDINVYTLNTDETLVFMEYIYKLESYFE